MWCTWVGQNERGTSPKSKRGRLRIEKSGRMRREGSRVRGRGDIRLYMRYWLAWDAAVRLFVC